MASSEKMNWIYEGVSGLVDKEEYLTGRKIDKTFEIAQYEKDGNNVGDFSFQENNIPSMLESSTGILSKLDLDIRLKEDPLQEIKRKQANIIKETLTNPVKMKRIKQLLEESLRKEKEEKRARKKLKKLKKKAKKLKKERKRSLSRSSNGSADDARDRHKRKVEGEREPPMRIKRERKDYSSESSSSRQASKHFRRENESNDKARSKHSSTADSGKHRVSKRDDFSKSSNNERVKVKQERRSVHRDRSPPSASTRHRRSRKQSVSSDSRSSSSSVNYSSSASSRSSSVSSTRDDKHRSRSKSIVRHSKNRRRSSSGSDSRVRAKRPDDHSDHRSSRDRKNEKYNDHKSAKDRYADRHGVKFDDRYRDYKPKDKLREPSRDQSSRNRSSRDRSSRDKSRMQVEEWPEDYRDMIPVIQSPRSLDPLKLAKPLRKERQEQKNLRLLESGQHDNIQKSDLNSLVDGVIMSRYNTNFNQNTPEYNNYDPNDEHRNNKRHRAEKEDDPRGARKKNRSGGGGDDEKEMEAKRKQMMANAEWRETERSKDVRMHVREYEQEAMEIQSSLNKNYSARYY